jgi:alpha-tubulin suppressor-like RCC1 family protein
LLGIKNDGTLWTWGYNGDNGQLGQNNATVTIFITSSNTWYYMETYFCQWFNGM